MKRQGQTNYKEENFDRAKTVALAVDIFHSFGKSFASGKTIEGSGRKELWIDMTCYRVRPMGAGDWAEGSWTAARWPAETGAARGLAGVAGPDEVLTTT